MTTSQTAESKPSALKTLVAVFIEPGKAFLAVQSRSMIVLPLLLAMLGTTLLLIWYYQVVDISWLQDKLTASIADAEVREKAKGFMSRNFLMSTSVIVSLVVYPLMFAISALYYLIVSKIRNLDIGYGKWFAFATWSSVPGLLLLPLGALQILMADAGKLTPGQLNPVSLNSMLFHFEEGAKWASLLGSLSLTTLWTWVVMVIGFQAWSKASRATSAAIVLLPYIVLYGVWAGFSFMSKAA